MKTRRILTILLFTFLSTFPLSATEEIPELLERWQTVENAMDNWQNAAEISPEITTNKLLASLEQFNASLEDFTGSLLFLQYEGAGLLPKDSGKTTRQRTKELTAAVKRIAETESPDVPALAAKTELTQKADAIRQTLYLWSGMDAHIASNVFSRSIYIFGVFIFFVIGMIIAFFFLYRALRRSQILEQDSSDFSRTTLLVQEKQRAIISAELHDTVLQDMGRLLQISNDTTPKELSELALQIMTRTREICRTLMPPDFSRLALTDSLIQLCADFEKRTAVECRVIIDKDFTAEKLSPQMQLQIYRIIQEALSNIEKHSEAKEVTLTARNKEDTLLIHITDDGKGLTPNTENAQSVHSGSGLGIRGMHQRAAMLGATLTFVEGAGSGLTVRLEIPLSSEK